MRSRLPVAAPRLAAALLLWLCWLGACSAGPSRVHLGGLSFHGVNDKTPRNVYSNLCAPADGVVSAVVVRVANRGRFRVTLVRRVAGTVFTTVNVTQELSAEPAFLPSGSAVIPLAMPVAAGECLGLFVLQQPVFPLVGVSDAQAGLVLLPSTAAGEPFPGQTAGTGDYQWAAYNFLAAIDVQGEPAANGSEGWAHVELGTPVPGYSFPDVDRVNVVSPDLCAPVAGNVTLIEYYASFSPNDTNPVTFRVMRATPQPETWRIVHEAPPHLPPRSGLMRVAVSLPVAAGDCLGIGMPRIPGGVVYRESPGGARWRYKRYEPPSQGVLDFPYVFYRGYAMVATITVERLTFTAAASGQFRVLFLRRDTVLPGATAWRVVADSGVLLTGPAEGTQTVTLGLRVAAGDCLGVVAPAATLPLQRSADGGTQWFTAAYAGEGVGRTVTFLASTVQLWSYALLARLLPDAAPPPAPFPGFPAGAWVGTGTGAPLPFHSYFERVGGVCPNGTAAAGLRFRRSGCNVQRNWTDGDTTVPPCTDAPSDPTEGLTLELLCVDPSPDVVVDPAAADWVPTGVGSPLVQHLYFDRLGAECPPERPAVTGVRFRRGGFGIWAVWDDNRRVDYSTSTSPSDQANEGLVMELRCAPLVTPLRSTWGPGLWAYVGVGTPLPNHSALERVGGRCRHPNELAFGFCFIRGGCDHAPTVWTDGVQDSAVCNDANGDDDREGLALGVLCSGYVPPTTATPTPTAVLLTRTPSPSGTRTRSRTPTPSLPPTATGTPVALITRTPAGEVPPVAPFPLWLVYAAAGSLGVLGLAFCGFGCYRRQRGFAWGERSQPLLEFGTAPRDRSTSSLGAVASASVSGVVAATGFLRTEEVLGRGGYGTVYRGLNADTLELVAMKEVAPGSNPDGGGSAALRREIAMLSRLSHPNIVRYLGVYTEPDGRIFIAMELLMGGNLRKLLQCSTAGLTVRFVLPRLREVLEGLVYLHRNDIVHRDVKPENVLLDTKGVAKLADFGIAIQRRADTQTATVASTLDGQTSASNAGLRGTTRYLSPEAVRTGRAQPSCDVWALGVMAVELLTGHAPWSHVDTLQRGDAIAVLFHIGTMNTGGYPIPDSLPAAVRELLGLCLHCDPKSRATAEALLAMDSSWAIGSSWEMAEPSSMLESLPALTDSASNHYTSSAERSGSGLEESNTTSTVASCNQGHQ